jgi:death-on-curing protein
MTNYSALQIEQVLYIHEQIIAMAGGKQGMRDFALLHSALERCKVTYLGEDLYPSLFDKASALLHSLVMNHAFLDGNKRTAFAIMSHFINLNGFRISASQKEIVRFCISVDNDGLKGKQIVAWLEEFTTKIPQK